ncbi:hypothetical protein GGR57DRAFT_487068 [Xylariaceae sp. FL1272]|nr:hypothetical protein GGR57DRAFT_487068 [Xylariaceae sp. FL1272]
MMIPSSVRRIATAAPQSPLLACFAPTATRASTAFAISANPRCNQRRRYSSSKPSSPNDSPKGLPDGQVTASPSTSTKQSGEKRMRKAKDLAATQKLPSVPSTQNVPQEAVALSTFFSLHRPISVTHSFPRTISDDAFAQIFAQRTKYNTYNDVIGTLSQTVNELEQPMRELGISEPQETDMASPIADESMRKIDFKHPDGTESSVYVQLNHMAGQFLPFRPPPIPQPESARTDVDAEASTDIEAAEGPQTRVYQAMFTLEETIDENGEPRIVAHSPRIVEEDGVNSADQPSRSFLGRMAMREIRRGQRPDMHAISVKRQRKLKMKKKKYKKLMRRTRNERRKLDRV